MLSWKKCTCFSDYFCVHNSEYDVRNVGQLNIPRARTEMAFKRCDVKGARKWKQYYEITNKYLYKSLREQIGVQSSKNYI